MMLNAALLLNPFDGRKFKWERCTVLATTFRHGAGISEYRVICAMHHILRMKV